MPTLSRRTIIREGALAGLIGGAVFAAGQILAGALSGMPPGAPWQFFLSVLRGGEGIHEEVTFTAFVVGAAIHVALSLLFGMIFGAIVAQIGRPVRNSLAIELTGGALYGLVLWVINVQIVGQFLYPWYLAELNPAVQALIHALFFGVPMATWLALRIRDVEVPGVHEVRHRLQTSSGDEEWLRLRQWKLTNEGAKRFTHERMPEGRAPRDERAPPADRHGERTLH